MWHVSSKSSTLLQVVSQSEVHESNEDDVNGKADSAGIPRSTSRSSRASQPSLRLIMKAMSDVAPKVSSKTNNTNTVQCRTFCSPKISHYYGCYTPFLGIYSSDQEELEQALNI